MNGYIYGDEDNAPMNEEAWQAARAEIRTPDAQMPVDKPKNKPNCHDYCRYAQMCRYEKGSAGRDPDNCMTYIKLEELIWEATWDRMHPDQDDLPFTDLDEPDESELEDDDG